ncbi:MAG: LysM peptidoglycan-binding domain-containing protein [Gammaproteobacteria bacterium]|nr:LysM peptidoglycan-binding domain-containing protein [Gammaproteobacteria bacterium]
MIKNATHRPTLPLLALSFWLVSCATSNNTPVAPPEPDAPTSVEYVVQRGDRLSEIALKFTGQQSTWQAIAEYNNIDNPRRLREGATLQIPTALMSSAIPTSAATESIKNNTSELSAPLAVKRAPMTPDAEVVVKPVPTQPEFELKPLSQDRTNGSANEPKYGQHVKVVGSYYPKGIYTEPQISSRLLMRVTPGTQFFLASSLDGWFKIQTDQGIGFIRHQDAVLLTD